MNTPTPQVPIQAQITVTLFANGQVGVNGPLENKIVCYGLLEAARDAIKDYVPPEIPIVQPVNGFLSRQ